MLVASSVILAPLGGHLAQCLYSNHPNAVPIELVQTGSGHTPLKHARGHHDVLLASSLLDSNIIGERREQTVNTGIALMCKAAFEAKPSSRAGGTPALPAYLLEVDPLRFTRQDERSRS